MILTHAILLTALAAGTQDKPAAVDFSWDNLLLAWMKLDDDFEYGNAHVDSYMRLYRPNVWNSARNDEFELARRREETAKLMREKVAAFSTDTVFVIRTTMNLGAYDFERECFPIVDSRGNKFNERNYWHESRYAPDLPGQFHLYMSNPDLIPQLEMKRSDAEQFLKRRKDKYGNLNREVQVNLRVKILETKDQKWEFLGEIQSMVAYDDRAQTRKLCEATKKARKDVPPKDAAQAP